MNNNIQNLFMLLSPTSQEIKLKELQYLQIQTVSLSKCSRQLALKPCFIPYQKQQSQQILQRLHARNILSFQNQFNRTIDAFSFLLLKNVYGKILNENLLNMIKLSLFSDSINLNSIVNQSQILLSSDQMKKILVEFFFQLCFTNFTSVYHKKINKYPIVLRIMGIFMRCILVQTGYDLALNLSNQLHAETIIKRLSDYFDLNYRKTNNIYLFFQDNMFIFEANSKEVLIGEYRQSREKQYKQNNQLKQSSKLEEQYIFLKNNGDEYKNTFNFCVNGKSSNTFELQAPTPFFNIEHKLSAYNTTNLHNSAQNNLSNKQAQYFFKHPQNQQLQLSWQQQILVAPNNNSPSVTSFEDRILFGRSPIYNQNQFFQINDIQRYGFKSAQTLNQPYFLQSHSDNQICIDRQERLSQQDPQQCICKQIKSQKLGFNAQLYQINIEAKNKFQQNYDRVQYSKVDRQRKVYSLYENLEYGNKSTQNNLIKPNKLKTEQSLQQQDTFHSFYSLSQFTKFKFNQSFMRNSSTCQNFINCPQKQKKLMPKITFNYSNS